MTLISGLFQLQEDNEEGDDEEETEQQWQTNMPYLP
jgi:hypothetical protein